MLCQDIVYRKENKGIKIRLPIGGLFIAICMEKIVVATDIHGSALRGKMVVDAFLKEGADKLILLGDIYYHGPRNPLPEGHNPMALAEVLNAVSDRILCIKGNCDAEVDSMISRFEFCPPRLINVGEKKFFLMHGHESVPVPSDADVVFRGHFHVNSCEGTAPKILGLSSASLPKGGCEPCYAVVTESTVEYRNLLDGNTTKTLNI